MSRSTRQTHVNSPPQAEGSTLRVKTERFGAHSQQNGVGQSRDEGQEENRNDDEYDTGENEGDVYDGDYPRRKRARANTVGDAINGDILEVTQLTLPRDPKDKCVCPNITSSLHV
jgi:hypothetical protein